jgi:hypothetical protein
MLLIRQLARLGKPVSPNANDSVLAALPGSTVTAAVLLSALHAADIRTCLLMTFGQKAPLLEYLTFLAAVRVPATALTLDIAHCKYYEHAVPLACLTRGSDKDIPTEDGGPRPHPFVRARRVMECKGVNGAVGSSLSER